MSAKPMAYLPLRRNKVIVDRSHAGDIERNEPHWGGMKTIITVSTIWKMIGRDYNETSLLTRTRSKQWSAFANLVCHAGSESAIE